MKRVAGRFGWPTWLSAAGYFFAMALAARGILFYGSLHPPREELLRVEGTVDQVRLGGEGDSTWLRVESDRGGHRYSSYFGRDWPGMERLRPGDGVVVLAERKKANRSPLTGSEHYFWELSHDDQVIVSYDDVRALVEEKEAGVIWYADRILAVSLVLWLIAYMRRRLAAPQT